MANSDPFDYSHLSASISGASSDPTFQPLYDAFWDEANSILFGSPQEPVPVSFDQIMFLLRKSPLAASSPRTTLKTPSPVLAAIASPRRTTTTPTSIVTTGVGYANSPRASPATLGVGTASSTATTAAAAEAADQSRQTAASPRRGRSRNRTRRSSSVPVSGRRSQATSTANTRMTRTRNTPATRQSIQA